MSDGNRRMGDHGGIGSKNWYNAVNKQLASQLPGGSGSVDATRQQLKESVSKKSLKKVIQDLKGKPTSGGSIDYAAAANLVDTGEGTDELSAGLQTGLMAAGGMHMMGMNLTAGANPYILGGAALLGILGASSKRKAASRKGVSQAALTKEERMSAARQSFATNMSNILMGRSYQ